MTQTLEIGQTYVTVDGNIRKLVKIESNRCYFENLSKDKYDGWSYDGGGNVYSIARGIIELSMEAGCMEIYKG